MPTNIKNVSLLLERFGPNRDYSVYLDAYAFNQGADVLTYVATATKSATDINNRDWYNFVFSNSITISTDSVLFILRQDDFGQENFVTWVHADINSPNTHIYSSSYAFDSNVLSTDVRFTAYYSVYNQGAYSIGSSGYDFFTVFGLGRRQDFTRCIKIYDEFNNASDTREDVQIEIPGFVKNTKTWNNRQDWISGQKSNVAVLGDRLTLNPVPRRVGFLDTTEKTGEIHPSNAGLPSSILSFDFYAGNDEFNCLAFAGSELDGLYKSTNSGASWTKSTTFPGNNITSISFSSGGKVAVAGLYSTSKLYISDDSGTTWSSVDVTSNDQVNDIAWQDNDTLYLSTQTQGVLKYVISTSTLSSFNQGFLSPYPVGRKLFFESGTSGFEFGYGYGSAFGPSNVSFFDVFNVAGSKKGYSLINHNAARFSTYGYEYYSTTRLLWATSNGLYENDLTWDWFRIGESDSIDNTYSVYSDDPIIYVGTDTGLSVSVDGGVNFSGNAQGDTIKVKGLLQKPVVQIDKDGDNGIIYTAQNGALSSSKGVFFQQVMNDKTFDNNILDIVINPVNTDFVHILTESNIGQNDYMTFVVDNSSSIRFNDPDNKRKEVVEDVLDAVYASNSKARFQIIQFADNAPEVKGDLKDQYSGRGEAVNLTGGFTLNNSSDVLQPYIDLIGTTTEVKQQTSPLIDSLNMSMESIISGGLDWSFDSADLQYDNIVESRDDNASIAEHVIVIVTDGNDSESLRSIKDFVNNPRFENKVQIRAYIVVIGPDYNREVIYNLVSFFKGSNVLFCNTNANVDLAIEYISNQEEKNITEGSFRKVELLNETMAEVYRISVTGRIPDNTKAKIRYRYSSNNDSLMDENFSNWIGVADGENVIQVPSIQCRWFEYEIYLYKEVTDKFPLISEISINYRSPTTSTIVFDEKDYPSYRIGQMVVTRTITVDDQNDLISFLPNYGLSLYGYGLGVGYVNPLDPNLSKVQEDWYFMHSEAVNPSVADPIKPEKPSYTRRRVKEACTTTDYYNYYAKGGAWSKDLSVSVYKGDSLQSDSVYDTDPQTGLVRFHIEQSPATVVSVTITETDKRRLIQKIHNTFERLNLHYKNVGLEFLDVQSTSTSRDALPAFASQSVSDTPVVLDSLNVLSNSNNTITGQYLPDKSDVTATQSLLQVSINNYFAITFGDLFKYLDENLSETGEFEILPHQQGWIFNSIGNADSDQNIITLTSTESNVKLTLDIIQSTLEYAVFRVSGASGSITKSYNFTIGDTSKASLGFDFSVSQTSETGHLETDPNNSTISTHVWVGVVPSTSSIDGYLDYSASPLKTSLTAANLDLRVVGKTINASGSTDVTIQIINSDGQQPKSFIGLIDISVDHFNFEGDETVYPNFSNASVLMEESDGNSISQTVTLQPGINYVVATIQGTGITASSNALLYTLNNAQEDVYWGDLNVPSAIGTGRQSPSFIYSYARDIAHLDFCCVADDYDLINSDKYPQIDRWADYYNANNQFVAFSGFRFVPYSFSSLNVNQGVRTYVFKNNIVDTLGSTKPDIKTLTGLNDQISNAEVFSFTQLTSYNFDGDNGDKYGYNFATNSDTSNSIEVLSEHGSIEKTRLSVGLVDPADNGTNNSYFVGALNFDDTPSVVGNSNSVVSRPGLYHSEMTRESIFPPNNNRPITGVWSSSLNRDNIYTALVNGRSFATTGNRMTIDFSITAGASSYKMGEKLASIARSELSSISFNIQSITEDDGKIEIFRFGNFNSIENSPTLIESINVFQDAPASSYLSTDNFDGIDVAIDLPNTLIYYVKVTQNDGHFCIGSPIYISLST